jgi:hypothetical protein
MSSDPEVDPVALLKEIAQIAMDRMNYGADVGSWEAMTLGKITGVAVRYPGVLEGLRDVPRGPGIIFDHEFAGADLRCCGRPGCGRPAGDHQYSVGRVGGVGGMSYEPDDSMRAPPVVTD